LILLVDLDEAKVRLRLDDTGTAFDDEVLSLIGQASAIVLDYCNTIDVPDTISPDASPTIDAISQIWPGQTRAPEVIRAAVFRVLCNLFENREEGDVLSQATRDMLHRFRDPVLA
jgi:hypothetical protein